MQINSDFIMPPVFGINPPALKGNHDIHVVPHQGYWATKNELLPYYTGVFMTQTEAIASGMEQARSGLAHLVVHGRDGRIRDVRDYTKKVDVPD